jgi:integration host factor subunit beta
MNLSNLVERLHKKHSGLSRSQVERAVQLILEKMISVLARNGRIELRGFGVFFLSKRNPRQLRNPRSGGRIYVASRMVPRFRAGKRLKDEVDKSGRAAA